jgi:hypothetical protein
MYTQEIHDQVSLTKFAYEAQQSGIQKRIDEANKLLLLWITERNKEVNRGGYLNNAIILADIALQNKVKELTKHLSWSGNAEICQDQLEYENDAYNDYDYY